ncbi:hypothetical protein J5N97_009836 [Dioscorea zingiberensis]|uniref:BHLH domain-containing protein n=1 Tax=Dioscorea zingiberensis TaxID=325984 RepID=A0A9D5CXX2_9LILI|nr:hypothetical protein J5N97_009836 [Dioscorea zingiberensis]
MDSFCFQEELLLHEAMLYYASFSPPPCFDDAVTAISDITSPAGSAFVEYSSMASNVISCLPKHNDHGAPNVHRRIMSFLKSMPKPKQKPENSKINMDGYYCSREFRHMMRERHRREKLSQSYSDLYSILVPRSKADKKSIVQSATVHLKELNKVKEELHVRNKELRERIDKNINHVVRPEAEAEAEAGAKIIGVRLMNPASTIDSMIGALQCVKGMGAMATTIHSDFSGEEFTAVMTIQTKIERSEVEKAVEKSLMETEKKLRIMQVLRSGGGWAHQHFQQDQLNVGELTME